MSMSSLRNTIVQSDHWLAKTVKYTYRNLLQPSIPAPKIVFKPILWLFLAIRTLYFEILRIFFCEPLFKAYCESYGKGLHTTAHLPWVSGSGRIILGDHVMISGRFAISFASSYTPNPSLTIGNHTDISNGCSFVVGKSITIGDHVLIGQSVQIRDSNGHATDPVERKEGKPAATDEVKPVVIEDNVWIGNNAVISPGVTIGEGSIISASSVVVNSVPPYTIVSGFPARKIGTLEKPE